MARIGSPRPLRATPSSLSPGSYDSDDALAEGESPIPRRYRLHCFFAVTIIRLGQRAPLPRESLQTREPPWSSSKVELVRDQLAKGYKVSEP